MIKLDPELLGKEVSVGNFSVTEKDIREFAEAIGDLKPDQFRGNTHRYIASEVAIDVERKPRQKFGQPLAHDRADFGFALRNVALEEGSGQRLAEERVDRRV